MDARTTAAGTTALPASPPDPRSGPEAAAPPVTIALPDRERVVRVAPDAAEASLHVEPELVRAVQRGEPHAMDALIRGSYAEVYALCLRLLGDRADAADATQEVYLRVVRTVLAFRADAAFGGWLYRVTVGVCAAARQGSGEAHARGLSAGVDAFAAPGSTDELADEAPGPAARAEQADLVTRATGALGRLSQDAREVVVLRDVQGLSTRQAAAVLGVSEGAVKVRLHRAHARLRELVGRIS